MRTIGEPPRAPARRHPAPPSRASSPLSLSSALSLSAAAALAATLGACGSTPARSEPAPALTAGGVALPPDAEDPTARNTRLGYGRWKAAPEPEGTREQTHHSRRTHRFGND